MALVRKKRWKKETSGCLKHTFENKKLGPNRTVTRDRSRPAHLTQCSAFWRLRYRHLHQKEERRASPVNITYIYKYDQVNAMLIFQIRFHGLAYSFNQNSHISRQKCRFRRVAQYSKANSVSKYSQKSSLGPITCRSILKLRGCISWWRGCKQNLMRRTRRKGGSNVPDSKVKCRHQPK